MRFLSYPGRFDPVHALQRLQDELERVFENPLGFELGPSGRGVFPPVNVFTDAEGAVLRVEIPGVAPEHLSIEANGRSLRISGKRETAEPARGGYHRRERWSGEFARSLSLPEEYDVAKADAEYKHGVLTVRVPKREEAKPRLIEVKR